MDGNFKQVFDPLWNRNCNLIDRAKRIRREDKTEKRKQQKKKRRRRRLVKDNVRKLRNQPDGPLLILISPSMWETALSTGDHPMFSRHVCIRARIHVLRK
ncbi:hypothetical protein NC651_002003 [Populus alba x Populus x berolinensis]|nr:hypothetical protein NC651_002003 [Populus alba x Populus x berolinensis]